MAGKTVGRKPKLTRELELRLCNALRVPMPREVACPAVGISSRALRYWLERAEKGEARYVEFAENLEKAQCEGQAHLLAQIRKHGAKDWRAPAWLLERIFAKTYGPRAPIVDLENKPQWPAGVRITIDAPTEIAPTDGDQCPKS
jgi:hypothetical protein